MTAAAFLPSRSGLHNEQMDETASWLVNADDGALYSKAGESDYNIGQVREDSIVSYILDRETSTISFEVHGKPFGVACASIPDVESTLR